MTFQENANSFAVQQKLCLFSALLFFIQDTRIRDTLFFRVTQAVTNTDVRRRIVLSRLYL